MEPVDVVREEAEHRTIETLNPPRRGDKPVGKTNPRVVVIVVAAMVVVSHSH